MEIKKEVVKETVNKKKYKNVGFRLEEELFNDFEKIAQKNGGVSIHTYIKDHLNDVFKDYSLKLNIPKEMIDFLEEIEEVGDKRKTLNNIQAVVQNRLADYIFKKMLKEFEIEYFEKISGIKFIKELKNYNEEKHSATNIKEVVELINIYTLGGKSGISLLNDMLGKMIEGRIQLILKKYPPKNKSLEKYFLNRVQ